MHTIFKRFEKAITSLTFNYIEELSKLVFEAARKSAGQSGIVCNS